MKYSMWRAMGGAALLAVLLAFAHPAGAEGMRLERRHGQAALREELRAEHRESQHDWRDLQAERADEGRRVNRLDARYEQDQQAARRLSPEERRQLRRELQDAARVLYTR